MAWNNLAVVLAGCNETVAALKAYEEAIAADPHYADPHANAANLLMSQGKLAEAEAAYRQCLTIDPKNIPGRTNLAALLVGSARAGEALPYLARDVIKSPLAHQNRASARFHVGQLEGSLEDLVRIIDGAGDEWVGYGLLSYVAPIAKGGLDALQRIVSTNPQSPLPRLVSTLDWKTDCCRLAEAIERMGQAPGKNVHRIESSRRSRRRQVSVSLPSRCVALFNFGRSGSGFLHALVDGHSCVSTLPGVYFKGFFDDGIWEDIRKEGPANFFSRFRKLYGVYFDARASGNVPGYPGASFSNLGVTEGFTRMGKSRDQHLALDPKVFQAALDSHISKVDTLDSGSFFRCLHRAQDQCLGRVTDPALMFYHIHNPNPFAFARCAAVLGELSLLMIVRDPLQSLESWLEKGWSAADAYFEIVYKITNMLVLLDHPRFQLFPLAAVRLEDIQAAPEVTMSALAKWMGVPFEESLLRTTMHGLRWWNDPSSALFEQDDPFGANSSRNPLKRQVGNLLNSEDQSRLAPLFAPFCRTFGYEDRLPKRLDAAVQDALDRLNEPFHFETRFAAEKGSI